MTYQEKMVINKLHSTVLIRHGTHLTTKARTYSNKENTMLALFNNSSQLSQLSHQLLVRFDVVKGSLSARAIYS